MLRINNIFGNKFVEASNCSSAHSSANLVLFDDE